MAVEPSRNPNTDKDGRTEDPFNSTSPSPRSGVERAGRANLPSVKGMESSSWARAGTAPDYAATHGTAEEIAAIVQGLREKAEEFRKGGGETYRPA